MALANEMKLVLVLDDTGFSASAKKAGDNVKSLADRFTGLLADGGKVRSMFDGLSRDLEGVAGRFDDLQKSLTGTAEAMQKHIAGGMGAANKVATEKWKKMAELYGDLKIEEGLKASADSASRFEIQKLAVNAMGLSKNDQAQISAAIDKLTDQVRTLNPADALKTLMAVRQGNDGIEAKVVDATLPMAVKAVDVMQTLGNIQGDMADEVTKLYGLADLRGQTTDPVAMLRTFDIVQRGVNATRGTVTSQDVDTVLRRQGELAHSLTDDGLAKVIGLIDQIKAMGDEAGSKGVATMGAVLAMFQTYAAGKGNENAELKQFVDAGLLGTKGLDLSRDSAGIMKRTQGDQQWSGDPVAAIHAMTAQILTFTKNGEKNRARFYHGKDTESDEAQRGAVSAYLQGLGMTQPAAQLFAATGVGDGYKHIETRANMTRSAPGIDQNDAQLAKTYAREMQEVNAELEKLKLSVGTAILPSIKEFMSVLGSVVTSARDFAENNPLATKLTALALVLPGIVLSFKGFMNMFGVVGTLGSLVSQLVGGFTGLGAAAGEAGGAAATSGGLFAIFKAHLNNTWTSIAEGTSKHMPALNASVLGMAGAFNGGGSVVSRITLGMSAIGLATKSMAKIVGGAFLRMIPLLGELLIAWDFINLLVGIKIGGARIDAWFIGWGDRLLTWALNLWSNIVSVFKTGSTKAAASEIAARNAELMARLKARNVLLDSEKPKDGKPSGLPGKDDPKPGAPKAGKPQPVDAKASAPNTAALARMGSTPGTGGDTARLENNPAEQAVKTIRDRGAAVELAANEAMNRFERGGVNNQTDAFRALSRELELTGDQLERGSRAFQEWNEGRKRALFDQARADSNNFALGYLDKNRTSAIALLSSERERTQAQLAVAAQAEDHEFAIRIATLGKTRDAERDAIKNSLGDEKSKHERLLALDELYERDRARIQSTWEERRALRDQEQQRALESATARMAREWADVGKAVDAIGVNVGNNFVSMLINSLGTGHLAVSNFIKAILTEIANAKLKQALADPLNGIISLGTEWLKSTVFGMTSPGTAGSAATLMTASDFAPMSMPALSSLSGFANGGIMTSMGPMQLRKYAVGGIATSPQLALYGEGSMNEAFVPLPDGRSIPVRMKGGQAGGNVQVNVINQTSTPVNAQQGAMRFDGKQMILDVVLSAATTPGAFRSGMKEAMKG